MPPKRPIQNVFGNDDDDDSSSIPPSNGTPPKKPRSAAPNGAADNSIAAQVAAAKARAQALMASMQSKGSIPSRPPSIAPTPRAPPTAAVRPPAAAGGGGGSIQAQLEAARAKVQAQMAALSTKTRPPSAPVASSSKAPTGLHPLLLNSSVPIHTVPSFKRQGAVPPESNPYLQASKAAAEESKEGPKQRSMHRGLQFHKPGRHVREAEELRQEQQMEELKRRIEESAKKAGMEDKEEKRLLRPQPPDVEWWDLNLLPNRSYEDVPDTTVDLMLEGAKEGGGVLLFGESSPIDRYIQHPIPIPAPNASTTIAPRGLMLTKKEQRKLRRQRRAADLQDKRDRIKMGLLPPDPPKVKLSNLMRVLTSEAVSDPTKIEAKVRREIAARKEAHERQNAERRLTDEQRREKVEHKKESEAAKGLYTQVYRIKHLISPKHKFKIRRNAQDHALTGVTLFHPSMALVVVEGSAKGLKAYKRLMTVRIDWTDPGQPREGEDKEGEEERGEEKRGFRALTTSEEGVRWEENSCELIFEGPIRERRWEGRGFRAVGVESDQRAREVLGEGMMGYWDVAKRSASQVDEV